MTNLPRNDDGTLQTYSWPGGYTIYYLCKNGDILCPSCANQQEAKNTTKRVDALLEDRKAVFTTDEIIVGAHVNYEDCHTYCDNCNKHIEPSYTDCSEENDVP